MDSTRIGTTTLWDRRRFVRGLMGLGALATTAALSACQGNGSVGGVEEVDGLEKLTFVLDYTPNTNHTGLYVAQEKGWYKDEGLEIEIVQPPDDGADALVGAGKAPLGMGYQDFMANYLGSANPLPVTAIAAVVQHNTSGIISRAADGITHPSALAGKRYGTLDVDTEKAIVRSVVESDGGDWDSVEVVPANSTDEVSGLKTDQFDAIWCFEGWAGQNAQVQDYPVNYFAFKDIDPVFDYYTPVIIANDRFLQEQPDTVKRFLAATAKGYGFCAEHPDEAADILLKAAPELDPELVRRSQAYLADKYVADAPRWGWIDPARWNRFYRWMGEQGLVEQPIAEGAGFSDDYLPET